MYVIAKLPTFDPIIPFLLESDWYKNIKPFEDYGTSASSKGANSDPVLPLPDEKLELSSELNKLIESVDENWVQFLISAVKVGRPWFSYLLVDALKREKEENAKLGMNELQSALLSVNDEIVNRKGATNPTEFLKHQLCSHSSSYCKWRESVKNNGPVNGHFATIESNGNREVILDGHTFYETERGTDMGDWAIFGF